MLRAANKALAIFAKTRLSVPDFDVTKLAEGQFLERIKIFAGFEFGQPLIFSEAQKKAMTFEEKLFYSFFVPILDRRVCQFVVVASTVGACLCMSIIAGILQPTCFIPKWVSNAIYWLSFLGALLPLIFVSLGRMAEGKLVVQSHVYAGNIYQAVSQDKQTAMRDLAVEVDSEQEDPSDE